MSECPICGCEEEVGLDPESVPIEIQPALISAVDAAISEAMGRRVPIIPGGGFRGGGTFTEHVPCDVLTKARRIVAPRFGARMVDDA